MRLFSDFQIFERPQGIGVALFRQIAWRFLALGLLFILFTCFFFGMHYLHGDPIYYTNENRNLSEHEIAEGFALFLAGGSFFAALGLVGVLVIPKR